MPGRGQSDIEKTLLFHVTSAETRDQLFRAAISCMHGHKRMRRRTDDNGMAAFSVTLNPLPQFEIRTTTCIISRGGYAPVQKTVNMTTPSQLILVDVELEPFN